MSVTPSAATGMRNTRIRLYAKVGKGYKGEIVLYYNRLNINSFFTGITPTVTNYAANNYLQVLAAFNNTYGLSLTITDRTNSSSQPPWTLGMTIPDIMRYDGSYYSGSWSGNNSMLFTTCQESLCWIGGQNIIITRIRGNPDFGTLITKPEIAQMRKVPVMPEGTYDTALLTWGYDFTDNIPAISNFLSSPSSRTYQVNLAAVLAQVTGLPFAWGNGNAAGALDLQGFTYNNYQQAIGTKAHYNSDDFNRCLVIYRDYSAASPPLGSGWSTAGWQGMSPDQDDVNVTLFRHAVFMHYNA
ncbi:hypothetical protein E2H08_03705 [Salmonella enterica subsp. enterica serovar Enteritidis]|nr:hypothetical protein [Salmonella enterica subsp. enterica serovar Enteritidis]